MAAHARLKNVFTEDEKYHNLMTWLISLPARSFQTVWVKALEDFIIWIRHNGSEGAEWTCHKVGNVGLLDLLLLHLPEGQREQGGGEDILKN